MIRRMSPETLDKYDIVLKHVVRRKKIGGKLVAVRRKTGIIKRKDSIADSHENQDNLMLGMKFMQVNIIEYTILPVYTKWVILYSPAAHGGRPLPMGWVY